MWREDPRNCQDLRADRSRSAMNPERDTNGDSGEVFTRDLDLPKGHGREGVFVRDRVYELRGSEARTLATVGAFRVVPANDLRDQSNRALDLRTRDLKHLREEGLVRTMPYMMGRTRTAVVTLTRQGRELLEAARLTSSREHSQAFYDGVRRPRELSHDLMAYRAYVRAAERLHQGGARVQRVVLEDELKRDYQRFLQAANRGRSDSTGEPLRDEDAIERWAIAHSLPFEDGHVQFPDLRIEYEDRDGRTLTEDVEIETPHYRGAHAAAKARSGFTRYRSGAGRIGGSTGRPGGSPFDPHAAEELLL